MSAGRPRNPTILEQLAEAKEDRDQAEANLLNEIISAIKAGHSVSVISRSSGISRQTIYNIKERWVK